MVLSWATPGAQHCEPSVMRTWSAGFWELRQHPFGMLVLGLGTFLPRAIRDVEKTGGPYGLEFMFCSVIHTSEG